MTSRINAQGIFGIAISAILWTCFFASPLLAAQTGSEHWVPGWATAVHEPIPLLGQSPETFQNQTLRMVVRTSIAGRRLRIVISNAFSDRPLDIGAAHIALAGPGCSIVPESDRVLTFSGRPSIAIPGAAEALSDPVELKVPAFGQLSISLFLPSKSTAVTFHALAQHGTCVSGQGDFTARTQIANPAMKPSWYWLEAVDLLSAADTRGIAAFGDSITDGAGARQGDYGDWPDKLAERLAAQASTSGKFSVINEGIGGNRILHDGAGQNALARLNRDVLSQPGLRFLIVLEGINDIGLPYLEIPNPGARGVRQRLFANQNVSADDLIAGLRQIIERAHVNGLKVFGCTLTPFQGAAYYSAGGEAIREAVNHWIRTSGAFDGVIDFDAAVRDPDHPLRYRPSDQSGDNLHPSEAGYAAMVEAVHLSLLSNGGFSAAGTARKPAPSK